MFDKSLDGVGKRPIVEIEPSMHRIFRFLKRMRLTVGYDCSDDVGGVVPPAYVQI